MYNVELLQSPFPHVIIRNFYSNKELTGIWKELDFLTKSNKFASPANDDSRPDINGRILANNFNATLDQIYSSNRNNSEILKINRKIFAPEIIKIFDSLSPLVGHIKYVNLDLTKIKYYETNNYYDSHYDTSRFTVLSYFFKEPKAFEGGNLYFKDYDYTLEIENNMLVFFVGCITHSSTPVIMSDGYGNFDGCGKYTMSQFLNVRE